ncbi:hypothetical protein LINGRAHAP2_LOCUS23771 [Linum grandiflorum]
MCSMASSSGLDEEADDDVLVPGRLPGKFIQGGVGGRFFNGGGGTRMESRRIWKFEGKNGFLVEKRKIMLISLTSLIGGKFSESIKIILKSCNLIH